MIILAYFFLFVIFKTNEERGYWSLPLMLWHFSCLFCLINLDVVVLGLAVLFELAGNMCQLSCFF